VHVLCCLITWRVLRAALHVLRKGRAGPKLLLRRSIGLSHLLLLLLRPLRDALTILRQRAAAQNSDTWPHTAPQYSVVVCVHCRVSTGHAMGTMFSCPSTVISQH
jgi:hypothetical protein